MSNIKVNNINVGDTSVNGVIQHVSGSSQTPTGNNITLGSNGVNIINGITQFPNNVNFAGVFTTDSTFFANEQAQLKKISNQQLSGSFDIEQYAGRVVNQTSSNNSTMTVDQGSAGNIVTIINSGTGTVTIQEDTNVTLYWAGTGAQSSVNLAQHGMATVYWTAPTSAYISGVGLS